MRDPRIVEALGDDSATRSILNSKVPPTAECRKRRTAILSEYAQRYGDRIAGWWFDAMQDNAYSDPPIDWSTINAIVRSANPRAVIAFSHGARNYGPVAKGVDDFTGGDTWSKQDLTKLTSRNWPPREGILWHAKIYCGNVYHG